eukprot:TRINITY_DN13545_c0_g2_i2.p1 TRINITY_DN13545_c0_g2~~TRINITY_DN13545_c0_g2_i2.p1  ORF type:complete len:156 (+),score=26.93 TRINITY_DN13545_c0_g2_i2:259-726(+)
MSEDANPSDYLAAERTFLAWTRTALAIMVFGFGTATVTRGELRSWITAVCTLMLSLTLAVFGLVRYYQTLAEFDQGWDELPHGEWGPMAVSCGVAAIAVLFSINLLYNNCGLFVGPTSRLRFFAPGPAQRDPKQYSDAEIRAAAMVAAGVGIASA